MRELILQMHVSLDGYVARPDGADWGLPEESPEALDWVLDSVRAVGAHVMGSATYREMSGYWPSASGELARLMNVTPKVVFSQAMTAADWPVTRIAADLDTGMAELKREPGKDLMAHGGGRFAQALSTHGLVDEYRLIIRPVAFGGGLPLFAELSAPLPLTLLDVKAFPCGTTAHVYRRGES
jgi:dihydrofolate reductase